MTGECAYKIAADQLDGPRVDSSTKTAAECFFNLSVNVRSFLDDSQARDPSRVEIALGSTLGGVKNFQAAQGLQIYSFTEIF